MLRPNGATDTNQWTDAVMKLPGYVYRKMVNALRQEVPDEQQHLFTEARNAPVNLEIFRFLQFPECNIAFHALTEYYGNDPWFDYGWIRCADDQQGAEWDPATPPDKKEKRMLVRFWGFTLVEGVAYAFVDYYTRHNPRLQNRGTWQPHPLLRTYRWNTWYHPANSRTEPAPPFFAIKVTDIIAGAVVFPDPDKKQYVLYFPTDLDLGDGDVGKILDPEADLHIPEPSVMREVPVHDAVGSPDVSSSEDSDTTSEEDIPPLDLPDVDSGEEEASSSGSDMEVDEGDSEDEE